ncbi:hypothetical protein [Olleya sp. HaHaR_3_96]|uniref:hypothetical protein n=1 Tax=Olleya sp. HaHaR_3_96 TaxID=2745560 RepID=UPI001C4EB5FE|nr:hypothetical protein [Olleya sp. HaHaR_3_96]QXP60869.1 hypothetical protein H0I26_04315 [Olleya sp. HaHaR_3_96]
MNGKGLNDNLHRFLRHLDSIKDTLPMTMLLLDPYQKKAIEKFQNFLKNNVNEFEDEDGKKSISIKHEESKIFETLSKNFEISELASKIIPESLFVSLISQYDAFLNKLLRELFKIRPEYINQSERELTFSELVKFESIEDAKEYIIEKEIESILRKNHIEQFDYLEKKINIPLRKNLPVWSTFIEITQRRNLFVHCDGIVSSQYLKVCRDNNCEIGEAKLNERLDTKIEYFISAYKCLYELATKLTHTIWRKLLPDDIKNADRSLNDTCFDLLSSEHFKLADILLEFGCNQKNHFNDSLKNVFVINQSLSKYLQNEKEKAKLIIGSMDWSASSDDFKLAHLVLTEDFENCYKLMSKIGKNGEVDKENYKTWPLFSELRKESKFKETYKIIFEEEYTVLEIPKRPVQELIEELTSKNPELKNKTVKKELSEKQIREKKEIS